MATLEMYWFAHKYFNIILDKMQIQRLLYCPASVDSGFFGFSAGGIIFVRYEHFLARIA